MLQAIPEDPTDWAKVEAASWKTVPDIGDATVMFLANAEEGGDVTPEDVKKIYVVATSYFKTAAQETLGRLQLDNPVLKV